MTRTLLAGALAVSGIVGLLAAADPVRATAQKDAGASVPATAEKIKHEVGEALKHAKEADAGERGKAGALVKHSEMALSKAKDAQRARKQ